MRISMVASRGPAEARTGETELVPTNVKNPNFDATCHSGEALDMWTLKTMVEALKVFVYL